MNAILHAMCMCAQCGATVCECDIACVPMGVRLHVYEYEEIVYEFMCVHA